MRSFTLKLLALTTCLLLALAPLRAAHAHAILIDSSPDLDSRIAAGHVEFHLRYNSRIDEKRSRLILTMPDKTLQVLKLAPVETEDMLVSAADLAPGEYALRWQVLAVDGHITRGDVNFTVLEH